MMTAEIAPPIEPINVLTPRFERLLHRIPQSPSYLPLVSTITGLASACFWTGISAIGCTVAAIGLVVSLPSFLIGEAIDAWNEYTPRWVGKTCLHGSISLSIGGIAVVALALFPFIRATIAAIPIIGNITLLIWDDYQEQQQLFARGYTSPRGDHSPDEI